MPVIWKLNGVEIGSLFKTRPILKQVNQLPDTLSWSEVVEFDGPLSYALDAPIMLTRTLTGRDIAAGSFVIGGQYKIVSVGTTNFVAIGAVSNTVGGTFVATGVGSGSGTAIFIPTGSPISFVQAAALSTGQLYQIKSVGSTDFTAIGAASNTVGLEFTATGAGTGTGLAWPTYCWFRGVVRDTPRTRSSRESAIGYEARGPWQWLERIDYVQEFPYANAPTTPVAAGAFVSGKLYLITAVGTTDFTAIGAASNSPGVRFTATGAGSGTGTAMLILTYERGRVILGQDASGAKQTPDAFITDVLNYALSKKPDIFQIGTIDSAISAMRFEEALNLTCAQVLQRVLQSCPDAVAFFDYLTNPPTIHMLRRGFMDGLLFDIIDDDETNETAGALRELVDLRSRPDLLRDSVCLIYLQANLSNDYAWETPSYDRAPAAVAATAIVAGKLYEIVTHGTTNFMALGAADNNPGTKFIASGAGTGTGTATAAVSGSPDTLTRTFELAGSVEHIAYVKQKVTVAAIPAALVFSSPVTSGATFTALTDFWQKHRPDLYNADITIKSFYRGTRTKDDGTAKNALCVNELLTGAITDWMETERGIVTERQIVTTDIEYEITVGGKKETHSAQLTAVITATSATSTTYSKLADSDFLAAEVAPAGLAQMILDSISALQWDGQIVLVQDDPSISYLVGRLVNLDGSLADWSTMNALIQQATTDLFEGRTTIKVGTAKHLAPDDLLEMFRPAPAIPAVMNASTRTSGISGAAQTGQYLTKHHPSQPGSPGLLRAGRVYNGAISVAGTVWTAAEAITAIQGNYSGATGDAQYPTTGDRHILTHAGAARLGFIVTTTDPGISDTLHFSFTVGGRTYYAHGKQTGIWK